eukprot:SAG11_NODE_1945_length_4019_cov_6.325510_4_plen_108_part_00
MPTILSLAGVSTPATMDGRSFAHLLNASTAVAVRPEPWRTELLVEYGGGGPVVRYQHLEDIHNNTFRLLRVVDPSQPKGQRNLKLAEFTGWANWCDGTLNSNLISGG